MNRWIERVVWVLVIAAVAFAWNRSERQAADLGRIVTDQMQIMARQTAQLDSIHVMLTRPKAVSDQAALKRSLMDARGLLPGNMRIFSEDHVRILNPQWAYAEFEDGHFMQAGLFRYERTAAGVFRWTLVQHMEF